MTDRGQTHSDAPIACPFVAFEDDRDERSDRPDHRHRCYADIHPAPRAIAHQEAYCLSNAFAVCPTFQDWAQREAARARGTGSPAARPPRGARSVTDGAGMVMAGAGDGAGGGDAGSAAREVAQDREREGVPYRASEPAAEWQGSRPARDEEPPPLPPRRNPPRDWAAPPPWAGSGGAGGGSGAVGAAGGAAAARGAAGTPGGGPPGSDAPGFLADRASRGLAGSAADRLAGGEPVEPRAPGEPSSTRDAWTPTRSTERAQPADEELAGLVRQRDREREHERQQAVERAREDEGRDHEDRAGRSAVGGAAGGLAGAGAGARPPAGRRPPPDNGPEAEDAPSWERPRRYEAYPTIKTRGAASGLPRLGVMAAALGIAALALFLLPAILGWFGDNEGSGPNAPGATATPSAPAQETASPVPTTPPAPTPQVYIVKSGDTMSKIATRFNVSLDDLLEANRETIPDPDRISIGDPVIIPAGAGASDGLAP